MTYSWEDMSHIRSYLNGQKLPFELKTLDSDYAIAIHFMIIGNDLTHIPIGTAPIPWELKNDKTGEIIAKSKVKLTKLLVELEYIGDFSLMINSSQSMTYSYSVQANFRKMPDEEPVGIVPDHILNPS